MGVDIHCYAEVSLDSRWQFVGEMIPNPEHEYDPDEPDLMPQPLFHSFHKELAAILTDSGNPIRSSVPYTPVVPPRGLPTDLSAELAGWLRRDEGATWLATNWFTRRELDAFGWEERIMRRRAMVDPRVAGLFAGCPQGFPLANWPAGVAVSYSGWMRDGVEVEWLESYAEIVSKFYSGVLPRLAGLGSPDQVRLVAAASW
jgi:hypothetical protein